MTAMEMIELPMTETNERRLSERILAALELAIDQGCSDTARHLLAALEASLTRAAGGPGFVERRDLSGRMAEQIDRYHVLARQDIHRLPPNLD